jgi:hypothetical protein
LLMILAREAACVGFLLDVVVGFLELVEERHVGRPIDILCVL